MALYNCKIDGDQYRITKFTNDLDVEASYLVSETECECPAGHRHGCRHRTMLPRFIDKGATSGQWFFSFEREQWIRAEPEQTLGDLEPAPEMTLELDHEIGPEPQQPHAFNMLDLAKDIGGKPSVGAQIEGAATVNSDAREPAPTPLKRRV